MSRTFRFKLSDEIMSAILGFSKVHEHDHRKDYKESWNKWIDDNNDLLTTEKRRLTDIGYEGNIDNKIYNAGRYYFRTKNLSVTEPNNRRAYIQIDKNLIDAMDKHIKENIENDYYTPAYGYDEFCDKYKQLLYVVVKNMCVPPISLNAREITTKIKKTYKNRYYIIARKLCD